MERQVDGGQKNAQVLQYVNGHKWIVIFVDIAWIFPLDQNITGLN